MMLIKRDDFVVFLKMVFLALFMVSTSFGVAQTCLKTLKPTTSHLIDNHNGTVNDPKTGLIWKKCSEGQSYNHTTNSCDDEQGTYTWLAVLQQAQLVNASDSDLSKNVGYTDWRVPNINELTSIVELSCYYPAINQLVFSNMGVDDFYWSSSPGIIANGYSWALKFDNGKENLIDQRHKLSVRLVRNKKG